MFSELINLTETQLATKSPLVVAISGFAGSGKSTLADKIAERFRVKAEQIIRLDNLYASEPRGDGLFDDYDWNLLKNVLGAVRAGKRLQYTSRGFENETHQVDELVPQVVIVEGIRLFRPKLMPLFDISVWIDCPPELALQRAKARDLLQGADEETMKRWDTEWGPKNQAYYDAYHPERLASFIYAEYA